jgi:hypothetical protein
MMLVKLGAFFDPAYAINWRMHGLKRKYNCSHLLAAPVRQQLTTIGVIDAHMQEL